MKQIFVVVLLAFASLGFCAENTISIYSGNIAQINTVQRLVIKKGLQAIDLTGLPQELILDTFRVDLPEYAELASIATVRKQPDQEEKNPPRLATVNLAVRSVRQSEAKLPLSYITRGLSWKAIYNIYLPDNSSTLNMDVFFQVSNMTDCDFRDYALDLISGDLRFDQNYRVYPMVMSKAAEMDSVGGAQTFGDYYRFPYPGLQTLRAGEEKLLFWKKYSNVLAMRDYVFTFRGGMYPAIQKEHASIRLKLVNSAPNNLGVQLPGGDAYIYAQGSTPKLLGKVALPYLAVNEGTELEVGRSFDLYAEKVHKKQTKLDANTYSNTYAITVSNSGTRPAIVKVMDMFYGQWEVTEASLPYTRPDANQLMFTLTIPAHDSATFSYTVKNQ